MPFYRVNGLPMHIKFSGRGKPPAPCVAMVGIESPAGARSQRCCDISAYLCDWPAEGGKTCDAPLCARHAWEVSRDRHLCPLHHRQHLAQQPQLGLFTALLGAAPPSGVADE